MKIFGVSKKMPSIRDYLEKQMNLLPEDIVSSKKKNLKIILYALVITLFVFGAYGYNFWLDGVIVKKLEEKSLIETQINKITEDENEQQTIHIIKSRIEAKSDAVMRFELISPKVIPVLNSLENNMPKKVFLNSISKNGSELSLSGSADSQKSVAEYLHNLKEEDLFSYVAVESISENYENEDNKRIVYFSMSCKFRMDGGGEDGSI